MSTIKNVPIHPPPNQIFGRGLLGREVKKEVQFSIEDNGQGIPENVKWQDKSFFLYVSSYISDIIVFSENRTSKNHSIATYIAHC